MAMTRTGRVRKQPLPVPERTFVCALEGIDGSGKSTAHKHIAELLRNAGLLLNCPVQPTYSGYFGQYFRQPRTERLSPQEEYWLLMLDRAEQHRTSVQPVIEDGTEGVHAVLFDRHCMSSVVYQNLTGTLVNSAQQVLEDVRKVARVPDKFYLFDLDPEAAMNRREAERECDVFETLSNLDKYRSHYLFVAEIWKTGGVADCMLVDASLPPDEVAVLIAEDILKEVVG